MKTTVKRESVARVENWQERLMDWDRRMNFDVEKSSRTVQKN